MDDSPGFYAIIPADVRYDKDLTANSKLLYGEITALCSKEGFCWASNAYFAELYGVSMRSISGWISQLADKKYITIEIIYRKGSKEIQHRYVRILPGVTKKTSIGNEKNFLPPIEENFQDITTKMNTTSNGIGPDAPASFPPRFKKPTIEEVRAYCQERGDCVAAEKWYSHYEANGWKVGKNPMKDWKAAVRTWEPDGYKPPRKAVVKLCPLCGKKEVDGLCMNPACSQYDEAFRGGKSAEGDK
jgi:hypothetical protein